MPVAYGATSDLPVRWYARQPLEAFRDASVARGLDPGQLVVLEPGESWHYHR